MSNSRIFSLNGLYNGTKTFGCTLSDRQTNSDNSQLTIIPANVDSTQSSIQHSKFILNNSINNSENIFNALPVGNSLSVTPDLVLDSSKYYKIDIYLTVTIRTNSVTKSAHNFLSASVQNNVLIGGTYYYSSLVADSGINTYIPNSTSGYTITINNYNQLVISVVSASTILLSVDMLAEISFVSCTYSTINSNNILFEYVGNNGDITGTTLLDYVSGTLGGNTNFGGVGGVIIDNSTFPIIYYNRIPVSTSLNVNIANTGSFALPNSPIISTNSGFSISGWIKITGSTTLNSYWFNVTDGGSNFYNAQFNPTGPTIQFFSSNGPSNSVTYPVSTSIWTHVVWTIDISNNSIVYINGIASSPETVTSLPGSLTLNTNFIGGNGTDANFYDTIFFNYVLSSSQVDTIYNSYIGLPMQYVGNPNDVTSNMLLNYSTNGTHDATITTSSVTINTNNHLVGYLNGRKITSSYYFNNGQVTIPNFTSSSFGFSVSFWILVGNITGTPSIFQLSDGGSNQYSIAFSTNTDLTFNTTASNTVSSLVSTSLWNHITWTIDGSNNSKVYLNGILNSSFSLASVSNDITLNANTIGSTGAQIYLYDIRFYLGVLTSNLVSNVYQSVK